MEKRKRGGKKETTNNMEMMRSTRMELKFIMKDIQYMGPSHMTWKDKKAMEDRKLVSLGGKPSKKQRLPLSVARVPMKKQKEREQEMLEENIILGHVGGKRGNCSKRASDARRPEDRVLISTAGHFRNGVLDVKDLLKSSSSSRGGSGSRSHGFGGDSSFGGGSSDRGSGKGGKKKGRKKKKGSKGGRRKDHWSKKYTTL